MGIFTKTIDLQKLNQAWDKVKSNRPSAGSDNITADVFEASRKERLMQLNLELKNRTYKPQPAKIIKLIKGDKDRDIALFSMRDKVVQQAINTELTKIYEPLFNDSCCAYRPGRSAAQVSKIVERKVMAEANGFVLKTDINSFFDNVNHDKLIEKLKNKIAEPEMLELIKLCIQTPFVGGNGETGDKLSGIYQGSAISPILSNIYLKEFDEDMIVPGITYLRYSDDILVIGEGRQPLELMLEKIKGQLLDLGLKIKDEKTELVSVHDGFIYLGYKFDDKGKSVPYKAEKELMDRLENVWFSFEGNIKDRIQKGREILGGWSQYYNKGESPDSIYEYVIRLDDYIKTNPGMGFPSEFVDGRFQVVNIHKDILKYMDDIWAAQNRLDMCLKEYEQFYGLLEMDSGKFNYNDSSNVDVILDLMRRFSIHESEEILVELVQCYTDNLCYLRAGKINEMRQGIIEYNDADVECSNDTIVSQTDWNEEINLSDEELQKYMETFVSREDRYAEDNIDENGKRKFTCRLSPLTPDIVRKHIRGDICAATYVQRSNSTVHFMVIDVDVSKKVLLQYTYQSETFNQYLLSARKMVLKTGKVIKHFGLDYMIEDSGYRGYHIWIFFSEWIPTRYANMFQDILDSKIRGYTENEITIEYFPNKTRVKADKAGQVMKMPWGFNLKTGKRCVFVNESFNIIEKQTGILQSVKKVSLSDLKRIIALNGSSTENETREQSLNMDISSYGRVDDTVAVVLEHCGVIRYLCAKAKSTGYLTHYERLTVVYVFGHLGDEGRRFVHRVMENTLNYKYSVTEKFIQKLPQKPISCIKLREQYSQITAEIGCNCSFKRTGNCYPSPVLHALKDGLDEKSDITMPVSRELSKEKEKQLYEEINVHKKAQELAGKLLQLRKQKRGIDRSIIKFENELSEIFDGNNVECMEIDMGLLVRRKIESGYEWVIEI